MNDATRLPGAVACATLPHMTAYTFYTGAVADRAALHRADENWLERARNNPTARFAPLWRNRSLLRNDASADANTTAVLWTPDQAAPFLSATFADPMFLGLHADGSAAFAIDLSHLDETAAADIAGDGVFLDLWEAGPTLRDQDAALLAYARGLAFWHRRHRFCGRCGNPSLPAHGGHLRRCTNPDCAAEHFPRTDPAVIMLVEGLVDGRPACLLGRQARWTQGMYSTLAGFVEPGESLEEAVGREVLEETGVGVSNATYMGSQPWPFPASIMLGFRAQTNDVALNVNYDELEDARWFTRDDLRSMGEKGFSLPRRHTIAYRLIAEWLAETDQTDT
ncbi:MAG: NAD(+) diphosphatase [Rhodospirillales bacterium]|nr:NAD(+) diphosphatase [Rhodospirillales bacterium]